MGQGAAPTSSLHPGALSTPLGSISLPLVGSWAAPAPGSRAAATRCQTRWGTEPYTSMSAAPALHLHPALHFRKRRTLRPPPSLQPPAAPGVGSRRQVTCTPLGTKALLPAAPRGWLQPVPRTLWVVLLLKLPARRFGVLALLFPSFPRFIYVSVYKLEWGPPRGQGSTPQPRCRQERVSDRAPLQSWPRPSLTPPRTTL